MATRNKEIAVVDVKLFIEALAGMLDDYNSAHGRAVRQFAKLFDPAPGLKLSTIIEQIRTTAESRETRQ